MSTSGANGDAWNMPVGSGAVYPPVGGTSYVWPPVTNVSEVYVYGGSQRIPPEAEYDFGGDVPWTVIPPPVPARPVPAGLDEVFGAFDEEE